MGGAHKPLLTLRGRPVLAWAMEPFLNHPRLGEVVVALPSDLASAPPEWLQEIARVRCVAGGSTRSQSVRRALDALDPDLQLVLVHDAARPFVEPAWIDACLAHCDEGRSAVVGIPAVDTIKRVDSSGRVLETPERRALWQAQTPQAFLRSVLGRAYETDVEGAGATDEASLVEALGCDVRMVLGSSTNLKITRPADLRVAEALLAEDGM